MSPRFGPCPRGVAAASVLVAAITGCGAATDQASLGSNNVQSSTVPGEVIRVGIVINNETTQSVMVDMDLDGAIVSYPVGPRDVLSLRLKCADVFRFVEIRYAELDSDAAGVPVDQETVLGVDYDCNEILLLNVDDQGGLLSVVPVDHAEADG